MALNLARIIGTITGKLAFERTDANFQLIQTDVNANTLAIADKLPTSHNTDETAHDDIRQQINDLANQPYAKLNLNNAVSLADGTLTKIPFNTVSKDNNNMADITNSRLVCKTAGEYMLVASANFANNVNGDRELFLLKNGSLYPGSAIAVSPAANTADRSVTIEGVRFMTLAVNDYIEIQARQNSGGALNILGSADAQRTFVVLKRIGD